MVVVVVVDEVVMEVKVVAVVMELVVEEVDVVVGWKTC